MICPALSDSLHNHTLSRKEGYRKSQARLSVTFTKKDSRGGRILIPATQQAKPTMATTTPAELPSVGK